MTFLPGQQAYTQATGTTPTRTHVFVNRAPTVDDVLYPVGIFWNDTADSTLWYLASQFTTLGNLQSNWLQVQSSPIAVETLTANSGVATSVANNINVFGSSVVAGTNPVRTVASGNTLTVDVQTAQAIASTDATKIGLAAFNSSDFTVDANGFVSAKAVSANYTNVTHAMSPYTVLTTDNYISVDCSAGTVQLNFFNAPTFDSRWVIKDRTGNAATNNITLTTPGGIVTFDGLTTYTMNSNYQAINLLANATPTYEVY